MKKAGSENIFPLSGKILDYAGGTDGVVITNTVGQRWIVPEKNMGTALELFQPSTFKGKMVKRFLPCLSRSGFVMKKLGMSKLRIDLISPLKEKLAELFSVNVNNMEFSVFCGSPGVHRKITLQIFSAGTILGYCKVTDTASVIRIFEREQKVLDELCKKGIDSVPVCLYCGPLVEGIHLFVQSTKRSADSRPLGKDRTILWAFLEDMNTKMALKVPFAETDYFHTLNALRGMIRKYALKEAKTIERNICEVERYFEARDTFSAYHGDFTPWNTFVEDNALFAFDLEYFKRSYPPYMDYFHFHTQDGFYNKRWDALGIFRAYVGQRDTIEGYVKDPDIYYKAYLLDIIHFYLDRDEGSLNPILQDMYSIWIELLNLLSYEKGH